MNDLEMVVKGYLSKHGNVYTNTLYKALQVRGNYGLTLNKFRLYLRGMEKSGIIESVVDNLALSYWRLA